jgi:hypothetical protein
LRSAERHGRHDLVRPAGKHAKEMTRFLKRTWFGYHSPVEVNDRIRRKDEATGLSTAAPFVLAQAILNGRSSWVLQIFLFLNDRNNDFARHPEGFKNCVSSG